MDKYKKLRRFFDKSTKSGDSRQFFKKLLTLNSVVKKEQAQLNVMRESMKDMMFNSKINRLVGTDNEGCIFVVTISEGGNNRKEFNLEAFKKDNPELYRKYLRPTFSLTSPRLIIKEYKTPRNPCDKCKNVNFDECKECSKFLAWENKFKETMEQKALAEGEEITND